MATRYIILFYIVLGFLAGTVLAEPILRVTFLAAICAMQIFVQRLVYSAAADAAWRKLGTILTRARNGRT